MLGLLLGLPLTCVPTQQAGQTPTWLSVTLLSKLEPPQQHRSQAQEWNTSYTDITGQHKKHPGQPPPMTTKTGPAEPACLLCLLPTPQST